MCVWNDRNWDHHLFNKRVWMLWTHAVLLISAAGWPLCQGLFTNGVTIMVIIWIQTSIQVPRYELPTPFGQPKLLNFFFGALRGGRMVHFGWCRSGCIGALLLEYFTSKKGLIHLHEMCVDHGALCLSSAVREIRAPEPFYSELAVVGIVR